MDRGRRDLEQGRHLGHRGIFTICLLFLHFNRKNTLISSILLFSLKKFLNIQIIFIQQAIARFGTPEIINSDQGSQYTSGLWAEACGNTMKVSMDGRGRAKDNIWIERFWRTIKREYIYLNPCDNAIELRKGIEKFMQYYNTERHHQGIDNETPQRKYENNKLLIRTHEAA